MVIRAFYWHRRVRPRWFLRLKNRLRPKQSRDFAVGNAGDIYARELLQARYELPIRNVRSGGRRILCVGSIGHLVEAGDVVCGIGVKTREIAPASAPSRPVVGLRGPITYEVFAEAGYDVSSVRFLMDPGLLVGRIYPLDHVEADDRTIFIPHYRERWQYRNGLPPGVEMIDIDASARDVARAVAGASLVYASSLHGIIFAHALGRPCVYVRPQTSEGSLKYEDYYASVGLPYRAPARDIYDALRQPKPDSPADLSIDLDDARFPDLNELEAWGIVEGSA